MKRTGITFLVPSISGPVLGPVTELARMLQERYDVQIIGPDLGGGVCSMYLDSFDYTVVSAPHIYRFPDYFSDCLRIARLVSGEIVIAVKAFADTVPIARYMQVFHRKKAIVYLDEWDGALVSRLSGSQRWKSRIKHIFHPMEDVYVPWVERLVPKADMVWSTSTLLQSKFGGEVVPLGVDCNKFRPVKGPQSEALRDELGVGRRRLLVFAGVVRPHKGIECYLEALSDIADDNYRLVIVGPENEHVRTLKNHAGYGRYITCSGAISKHVVPDYLNIADCIIVPLGSDAMARSQVPCKIFEAMAMGKPIIANDVSDIAAILGDTGWIVPAGDRRACIEAMQYIMTHAEDAAKSGRRARERCLRLYHRDIVQEQLFSLVEGLKPTQQ